MVLAEQARALYVLESGAFTAVCDGNVGVVVFHKGAGAFSLLLYDGKRKPLVACPMNHAVAFRPHGDNAYLNFSANGKEYSLLAASPAHARSFLDKFFALRAFAALHGPDSDFPGEEAGSPGPLEDDRWMHLVQHRVHGQLASGRGSIPPGHTAQGTATIHSLPKVPSELRQAQTAPKKIWSGPLPAGTKPDPASSIFVAPLNLLLGDVQDGGSHAWLLPTQAALNIVQAQGAPDVTDAWTPCSRDAEAALPHGSAWSVLTVTITGTSAPAPVHTPAPVPATPPQDGSKDALVERMARLASAGKGAAGPMMMIGRARARSSASASEPVPAQPEQAVAAATPAPTPTTAPAPAPIAATPAPAATAQELALVAVESEEDTTLAAPTPAPAPAPMVAAPVPQISQGMLERVLVDTGRILAKLDSVSDAVRDADGGGRRRRRRRHRHRSDSSSASDSDSGDSRSRRRGRRKKGTARGDAHDGEAGDVDARGLLQSLSTVLGGAAAQREKVAALEGKVKTLRASLNTARQEHDAALEMQDDLQEQLLAAKRTAAAAKRGNAGTAGELQAIRDEAEACKERAQRAEGEARRLRGEAEAEQSAFSTACAEGGVPDLAQYSKAELLAMLLAAREEARALRSVSASDDSKEQLKALQGDLADSLDREADVQASLQAERQRVEALQEQCAELETKLAAAQAAVADLEREKDHTVAQVKAAFKAEALAAIQSAREAGFKEGVAAATPTEGEGTGAEAGDG